MIGRAMAMRFAIIGWLLLYAAAANSARATTITVTNRNDSGPGSLRQALHDANDGDTITFAVTGTITLTSGGLPVTRNLTISGPGANQLSVDGNQALLVFGIFPDKTAAISGLTVTNGQVGIWNEQATLALSNCVVSLNSADGVFNHRAALTVTSCIIDDNAFYGLDNRTFDLPPPPGHALDEGFVTIDDTIISDNSGSGIYNEGNLTITNSTLSGNSADGGSGGGISNGNFKAPGSSVTIINSTISGNSADSGGGIFSEYGLLNIVNSTISGNSAGGGGGIFNLAASVQIANSTISGNSADSGGGIYNTTDQYGLGTIETGNTVFNAGASGENIFNTGGTVTSDGYNICSDDGSGYLNGPGDQINTDPLLGPLQHNGGPTLTHALLPGSPAIDAGNPNFTPPPLYDQRDYPFVRVFNGRIDVGSFEAQPPRPRPRPTPAPRPTR